MSFHSARSQKKDFSYYWNLHVFFDPNGTTLREGSNSNRPPVILQYVVEAIRRRREELGENYRPRFLEQLRPSDLVIETHLIVKALKRDVSYRFLNLRNRRSDLYVYDAEANLIVFPEEACRLIADFADILIEAIHYRWSQILEDFNRTTPRITSKVRMQRDLQFRRRSLNSFIEWLLINNPDQRCFLCGEIIETDEKPVVDHMIPWSFLFSDDLWNLSLTHDKCNYRKSDRQPTKKEIDRLNQRNSSLEHTIAKQFPEYTSKKHYKELVFANEHDLLRKMWTLYRDT
jgi:5-methylcytosine-specific restriction endonuclease McrA